MMRLDRRALLLGGTALAASATVVAVATAATRQNADGAAAPAATRQPNIVLMLGDNVGYGVPASYNGGILDTPTPNLDRLAAEGVRLTNFNVENQCTPSRAALMTGRMPIRSGIGKAIGEAAVAAGQRGRPRRPVNATQGKSGGGLADGRDFLPAYEDQR